MFQNVLTWAAKPSVRTIPKRRDSQTTLLIAVTLNRVKKFHVVQISVYIARTAPNSATLKNAAIDWITLDSPNNNSLRQCPVLNYCVRKRTARQVTSVTLSAARDGKFPIVTA